MKIETFESLLKASRGDGARAYIPTVAGSNRGRVAVVFKPAGKVYYYRGTIHQVAQRMRLIPDMDVTADSSRVVGELVSTGRSVGYTASRDTITYLLNERGIQTYDHDKFSSLLASASIGYDEFDYQIAEYNLEVVA